MAKPARKPYTSGIQPHPCAECGSLTQRPKFCSNGCMTTANAKRKLAYRKEHGEPVTGPVRQCKVCGSDFRRPQRKQRDKGLCCSRDCGFELRRRRGIISRAIRYEKRLYARWARQAAKRSEEPTVRIKQQRTCRDCDATITKNQQRCDDCRIEAANRSKARTREALRKTPGYRARKAKDKAVRRARRKLQRTECFDPFEVFERDGWKCHICKLRTPKSLRGTYSDRAPELDHIVSLAEGGEHSRRNTACSCRKCNLDKGSRSIGQLRLIA